MANSVDINTVESGSLQTEAAPSTSNLFNRAFVDHPASVDETYLEHFGVATSFARRLGVATVKAMVHAVVPGLCCTSVSATIRELNDEIIAGGRGLDDTYSD